MRKRLCRAVHHHQYMLVWVPLRCLAQNSGNYGTQAQAYRQGTEAEERSAAVNRRPQWAIVSYSPASTLRVQHAFIALILQTAAMRT
jgi:hypothetical protein